MTRSPTPLPALDGLKEQARRLRAALGSEGQTLSHSKALELVAAQHGFRDWNTLHAHIGNRGAFDPIASAPASKASISASLSKRRCSAWRRWARIAAAIASCFSSTSPSMS